MNDHTFLENVKVALVGAAAAITATVQSGAVNLAGGRGNAVLLALGDFAVDGSNYVTVSLEESDTGAFAGEENAVANGGNSGAETCVIIGRTNGDDVYKEANGQYSDSVAIDGTSSAAGDALTDDVWVMEYTGGKGYVRAVVTVTGTVSIPNQFLQGQVGLTQLPNIVNAG